jgi:hypothetical protein
LCFESLQAQVFCIQADTTDKHEPETVKYGPNTAEPILTTVRTTIEQVFSRQA